ncbi:zinc finger, CCHC-type containing protein [Tanacetum coccineum]
MTLLAKVRCFLIQFGLSKVFWAEDTTISTYLGKMSPSLAIGFKTPIDMLGFFGWIASIKQGMLEQVVLYKNMGFNESGEYKKTFISSGVGTSSVHVLQRGEFEVERQKDHTFKVEPHGNVDHVAVVAVDKIYAHESLTFNNTVAYEVISKWKAGLKDDMDARSNVYVLSNGCKECSDNSDGYYWEYTPDKAKGNVLGIEIFRDQRGNTLRVSWSRFYNESRYELRLVAGIATGAFVKGGSWSEVRAQVEVVAYRTSMPQKKGTKAKRTRKCYVCRDTGHYARDCKEGKSDSAEVMHRDTTRKCHVCRETRHYARECKDKKSDTVKVVLQDTTRKCHLCGYTGHYARDCKGKKSDSKELVLQDTTRKCNVCGKTGHYARECKDKKSNTVKVVFKEIIGSGIRSSKKAQGWYLFFGSSAHVCYSRDMFVDYTPMINHKVILDNKDHVDVVRTGTVVLR